MATCDGNWTNTGKLWVCTFSLASDLSSVLLCDRLSRANRADSEYKGSLDATQYSPVLAVLGSQGGVFICLGEFFLSTPSWQETCLYCRQGFAGIVQRKSWESSFRLFTESGSVSQSSDWAGGCGLTEYGAISSHFHEIVWRVYCRSVLGGPQLSHSAPFTTVPHDGNKDNEVFFAGTWSEDQTRRYHTIYRIKAKENGGVREGRGTGRTTLVDWWGRQLMLDLQGTGTDGESCSNECHQLIFNDSTWGYEIEWNGVGIHRIGTRHAN